MYENNVSYKLLSFNSHWLNQWTKWFGNSYQCDILATKGSYSWSQWGFLIQRLHISVTYNMKHHIKLHSCEVQAYEREISLMQIKFKKRILD